MLRAYYLRLNRTELKEEHASNLENATKRVKDTNQELIVKYFFTSNAKAHLRTRMNGSQLKIK